ncbi:MAG TPA: hypothetical protein VF263_08940 [Longimicrobiaceae bacterium]
MSYMLSALVVAVLGAYAHLAVQAFRSQYLLVLNHRGGELFFFEKAVDGRYTLIQPVRLPSAVIRYARTRAGSLARTAPERVMQHAPGQLFRALQKPGRRARAAHV